MKINEEIIPEVAAKILKNYNDILNAEKNHPEDIVTFSDFKEFKKYMNSIVVE